MAPSGPSAFSHTGARLAVLALGAAFCGLQTQARPVPVRRASADTDGAARPRVLPGRRFGPRGEWRSGRAPGADRGGLALDHIGGCRAAAGAGFRDDTSPLSHLPEVPSEDLRRCAAEPCEDPHGDGEGGWRLLSPEA
ncbi:unnamed protein product [Symbiodinium sp. CCMP2456]|nr:unnamed protein product [Symbiodinium sp. CCMP2456]